MVFQYNPLDYLVETTAGGELVITVNRVGTTAPKLRYNLHDLGCSVPFRRLRDALSAAGLRPSDLAAEWLDLPLLFHYGRSDSTLAFYGANIAPADVEEALLSVPELGPSTGSFALLAGEDEEANKTLTIAVELRPGGDGSGGRRARPQLAARPRWPRSTRTTARRRASSLPASNPGSSSTPQAPGRSTATTCASSARTSTPPSPSPPPLAAR